MEPQSIPMEVGPPIRILNWSAWAPNLPTKAAWVDYVKTGTFPDVAVKKPPCKQVPQILRRRCTFVTRMVLETSLDVFSGTEVASDSTQTVCSRHGELQLLGSLLHDIHSEVPLSPTQFSNSVHHTATGYFDLVTKNKQTSRTISAGMSSFVNGVESPASPVTMGGRSVKQFKSFMYLGCDDPFSGKTNKFKGYINQVSVWNKALDGRDIKSLFNNGNIIDPTFKNQ